MGSNSIRFRFPRRSAFLNFFPPFPQLIIFPGLNQTVRLMSLTEAGIGSQLQPTWLMLSDWPPETHIVLFAEMAHGCNDLIHSRTYVNIFSVLPRLFLSLLRSCLHHFILCFPFFSIASITRLSVYFAGVASLSV